RQRGRRGPGDGRGAQGDPAGPLSVRYGALARGRPPRRRPPRRPRRYPQRALILLAPRPETCAAASRYGRRPPLCRLPLMRLLLPLLLVIASAVSAQPLDFVRLVAPFEVRDLDGTRLPYPFVGGFGGVGALGPRSQLLDLDADGDADLLTTEG